MLTSTPKKAVSSEVSLIKCLICAKSLDKQSENSCVWKFAVGFKRDNFKYFKRRVAADMQRIPVYLQKEMFSTADKG